MVNDYRGQLLIVGAIAIAIVLIGLTLVLNSAVFTENVAGGSSPEGTGEVTEFDRESVRSMKSLSIHLNHENVYAPGDEPDLDDDLQGNTSSYSRLLAESYADTGSAYVNVTYRDVTIGDRIVQRNDSDFSDPGDPIIDDPFELGWFVANFNVENVSHSTPTTFVVGNSSATLNVSVLRNSDNTLRVNTSIDDDVVSSERCKPTNGRVLLDLKDGSSYTRVPGEGCEFAGIDQLDPPYRELRFENGTESEGKYDIVTNDTTVSGLDPCSPANTDEPCEALAAWTVEFETRYETAAIDYNRTHNVSVYDR